MAYEVIKRVSGRAYRYRVESFRDPETRRVRGRWTYLGRVDPAEAGLPERVARRSSRDRLLDAVVTLLGDHDVESLSAGSIAREAGVAYGTFYRYFKDRSHAVREALLREGPPISRVKDYLLAHPHTRQTERERVASWMRDTSTEACGRRGIVRAWHVYSNADEQVLAARREAVETAVDVVAMYLETLNIAGLTKITSPRFSAYALVALVVAIVRDCALNADFPAEKLDGLVQLGTELCGLA